MKNKYFFVILMLLSICVFTSCGDDGDDIPEIKNYISINGEQYPIFNSHFYDGFWDSDYNDGDIYVAVLDEDYVFSYGFMYDSNTMPRVGNDFAQMNLLMSPMNGDLNYYKYKSGSAKILSTNPKERLITIDFDNLVMTLASSLDGCNIKQYTFDGTVTLGFNYYYND